MFNLRTVQVFNILLISIFQVGEASLVSAITRDTKGVTQDGGSCVCHQTCHYPHHNDEVLDHQPRNCADIQSHGQTQSGLYTVYVGRRNKPLKVYCDLETDGGGWLVFVRREDGTVNFYRDWDEYQFGFGDVYTEFWLGNIYLNSLTSDSTYKLRVDMEDFEGETRYAVYDSFSVGSPADKYTLEVGEYTAGDAGDSLTYQNGAKFTTLDQDNDVDPGNCASFHRGAGWYVKCFRVNPGGRYIYTGDTDDQGGIIWKTFHGLTYSMKFMEMKIRPSDF